MRYQKCLSFLFSVTVSSWAGDAVIDTPPYCGAQVPAVGCRPSARADGAYVSVWQAVLAAGQGLGIWEGDGVSRLIKDVKNQPALL